MKRAVITAAAGFALAPFQPVANGEVDAKSAQAGALWMDLPRLALLRAELRSRLAGSGVGDVQRYTPTVETAFRTMWRRWCATSCPDPGSGQ